MRSVLPLCSRLLCLLCWMFTAIAATTYASEKVAVAVSEELLADYQTFIHNRDLASIQTYGGKGARRDVIELVLLQQALLLGGFREEIELRLGGSYLRTMRDIVEGNVITSSALVWKDDLMPLSNTLFISRPLIREGEFVVGVFTTPRNTRALAAHDLKALTALTAVTSSQWNADVRTLNRLGFTHLLYSPSWTNMVRMMDVGRADITLAPFQQTADMAIEVNGITLVPIPGVKIGIAGSRHWGVSRKHPQGQAFYTALEHGLTLMEADGTIQRAYRECGFFHPAIEKWTLFTPSSKTPDSPASVR